MCDVEIFYIVCVFVVQFVYVVFVQYFENYFFVGVGYELDKEVVFEEEFMIVWIDEVRVDLVVVIDICLQSFGFCQGLQI